MNVQKAKSQIKKLAEEFDLKYNPNWFNFYLENYNKLETCKSVYMCLIFNCKI